MIILSLLWTLPLVLILVVQYGIGEWYLIRKKNRRRLGYTLVVVIMLAEIVYGVFVMKFVEYMEALGIAYLILCSFLFHKFLRRFSGKTQAGK